MPADRLVGVLAPTDGRWRSVRAGLFVLIAAQIAVLGHIAAGGTPPELPLLAMMSGLLLTGLRPLATRRRTFGVLLAAMAGTQVTFHLVLTLADHHPAGGHDQVRMLVFHAAAAVLSALLLAHGERLLFALHGWLTRLRPRLLTVPQPRDTRLWTAVVDRAGTTLRSRLTGSAVWRRGPPTEPAPSC